MRLRTFSNVLLPAPLFPTMPTASPEATSKETSSSALIRSFRSPLPRRGERARSRRIDGSDFVLPVKPRE